MKNSDKPAFATVPAKLGEVTDNMQIREQCQGLTKREYFAAKAMQGILSSGFYTDIGIQQDMKDKSIPLETGLKQALSFMAIECADELLKQLNGQ